MREGRKMGWLFVFKLKQEMYLVIPNWQNQCSQNCSWRNLLLPILAFWISYLVSLRYIKLLPIRLMKKYLAVHKVSNTTVYILPLSFTVWQSNETNIFCNCINKIPKIENEVLSGSVWSLFFSPPASYRR